MKFTTKVDFKAYVKLLYTLAYEKTILRLLLGVAALISLWILFYYLEILDLPKPEIYQYITLFLIAVVQPTGIFLMVRRNYKSSNQLQERLDIEISATEIHINGESYYMRVEFEKLYRIDERKKWFLLYQNNLSAIIIPKKDMSADQIIIFRNLLQKIEDVPSELHLEEFKH